MKVQIACICPARQKHQHDTVTLREALPFRSAVAIRNEIGLLYLEEPGAGLADIIGVLQEAYLRHGIEAWTVRGKDGALPPSRENIDRLLLTNLEQAQIVGDAADELYREAVMLPLLRQVLTSSPDGQTSDTTSAPEESSTPTASPTAEPTPSTSRQRPSRPSSIITIPTAGIEATTEPPAGASRSSQKSA